MRKLGVVDAAEHHKTRNLEWIDFARHKRRIGRECQIETGGLDDARGLRLVVLGDASQRVSEAADRFPDGFLKRRSATADFFPLLVDRRESQHGMTHRMPANLDEGARRKPAQLGWRHRPM